MIQDRAPGAFDILGLDVAQHVVDVDQRAVIAPIRAREPVALDGISDQTLFAFNVRGPLGKTKVNKDMTKTIMDKTKHKIFPLFHNGITIIAKTLELRDDQS